MYETRIFVSRDIVQETAAMRAGGAAAGAAGPPHFLPVSSVFITVHVTLTRLSLAHVNFM